MKGSLIVLVLAICFGLVFSESQVIVGTSENFDELITNNDFVLAEFYAPWCGHCKHLEPEYEKAAQFFHDENSNIKLVKIDATEQTALAQTYQIRGYPTLIFFKNGVQIPFDGERKAESIINWLKKKSGPASLLLNSVEEQNAHSQKGSTIIGLFSSEKSEGFAAFLKVAAESDDFSFGHRFGVTQESISLTTKNDEVKTFEGTFGKKSIQDWIQKEGYPSLVELDEKVWKRSMASKMPLLAVFLDPKDLDTLMPTLQEVAKAHYGSIISSWMNGVANAQLVSRWGGSGSVLPTAFLVTFPTDNPKISVWNEDTEKAMDSKALINFIKSSMSGEYPIYVKSETIPEVNNGPVKIVVGKSFDSIVNDPTKDVLIEFYAPWCGHCKKLEPIYNQLGKKFEGVDSITIAKMDGASNAAPEGVNIQGFPTILFFPAGDKKKFLTYEGNRVR